MPRTAPARRAKSNGHSQGSVALAETGEMELRDLRTQVSALRNNEEYLRESLADLELALEDTGWQRVSALGQREFSLWGLRRIREMARLSFLKNPLIRHAVQVQAHYVWGQGCTISAQSDEVNEVVQAFLDDPKNLVSFSSHQARIEQEQELQIEGDIFYAMFTNQTTGRVVVRRIHPDEIQDVITDPEDYMEPWFYKRMWMEQTFDFTAGTQVAKEKTAYYPDWRMIYNTDSDLPHPETIGGNPVIWDAPIYHRKVGSFADHKFGCPEVYSALDWARAVKEDLEDYATIRRAHSRFAWQMTTRGGKAGTAAAKTKLGTTVNLDGSGSLERNPPPLAGSTFLQPEGWNLNPIKTAGMAPHPEDARRLWLMVAAGTGIPETILSGNADVGNLATAKTLDRPTELQMENRRTMWADTILDILNYVVDMAIQRPNGKLNNAGHEVQDSITGLVSYELDDDESREIVVRYPSILRHEILTLVQAIVQAITLNNGQSAGLIDDRTASGMLLSALGDNEYDETIAQMFPDQALTFNAGRMAPPGIKDPTSGAKPLPDPQASQSSTDKGLGDMGDGSQLVTPGAAAPYSTSLIASDRKYRTRGGSRLMESKRKHKEEKVAN